MRLYQLSYHNWFFEPRNKFFWKHQFLILCTLDQEVIDYTDTLFINSKFENVMVESIQKMKSDWRTKSWFSGIESRDVLYILRGGIAPDFI